MPPVFTSNKNVKISGQMNESMKTNKKYMVGSDFIARDPHMMLVSLKKKNGCNKESNF